MVRNTGKVFIITQLEENIKANGPMTRNTGMESYSMLTMTNTKGTGKMVKEMARVSMSTPMAIYMKANG